MSKKNSYIHGKVHNHLKHSHKEDLVYICTNSRLLRYKRGPRLVQWYGTNDIHFDLMMNPMERTRVDGNGLQNDINDVDG